MMMESSNDWDLQAIVRSCSTAACSSSSSAAVHHKEAAAGPAVVVEAGAEFLWQQPAAATSLRGLDYLKVPFSITAGSDELLTSFPAAGRSRKQSGRKPGLRAPRPKTSKKSQLKKVVCEVPDGSASTDLWAWRKYGQKPIKGSPYPRGYYKCSSLKACVARKLVERNPEKPDVLIVTYVGEHCHAVPTMLSSLAGTTRNSRPEASTDDRRSDDIREDSTEEASSMTVDGGSAETLPDDDNALWPVLDMSLLDEYYPLVDDFLGGPPFDDGVDLSLEDDDGLGMSL